MVRSLFLALLAIAMSGCTAFQVGSNIPETTPEFDYLKVEPVLIDRGGTITLSWEARGVEKVAIEQYYGIKTSYDIRYDNLPPKGRLTLELVSSRPTDFAESQPYIYGATFYLMRNDKTGLYNGILAVTDVRIRCPYEGFFFGTDEYFTELCPLEPARETQMRYQEYENGFMLQRENTIYMFYKNPDGKSGPALQFTADNFDQLVGSSNHALVDSLGPAISPVVSYNATVQDTYGSAFFAPVVYMTLQNGQVIQYFAGAYTTSWRAVN